MRAAFVGFGDLGKQLFSFASSQFQLNEVVVFDDYYSGKEFDRRPFAEHGLSQFGDFSFFIGVGYKHLAVRRKIIDELLTQKRQLPALTHPTSFIAYGVPIPPATYVYPMCNIDKGVKLGAGVILNNSVTVSHDCEVGEASYLSPGVILSGNVKIGRDVFLGSGSIVANGVSIGDRVVAGIGTCITKNVDADCNIIGNPFKVVSKITVH